MRTLKRSLSGALFAVSHAWFNLFVCFADVNALLVFDLSRYTVSKKG